MAATDLYLDLFWHELAEEIVEVEVRLHDVVPAGDTIIMLLKNIICTKHL